MVRGIPKTEKVWVKRTTENGSVYYTTLKVNDRSYYYLYKLVDGKAVKLGKSKFPTKLDEKYIERHNKKNKFKAENVCVKMI